VPSQPPTDTYDHGFSDRERRDIGLAVAYLECYLVNARQDIRRLYRHGWQQLYRGTAFPGRYVDLLRAVADSVRGHVHEPLRADEDHLLAGVFERMTLLTDAVRGRRLQFAPAQGTRWSTGPGHTVELSDRFFTLSRRDRVLRLLTALVEATPAVPNAQIDDYVDMIDRMAEAGHYGR
jgi:hypothetical protein